MERTLVLIKPHVFYLSPYIQVNSVTEIISRYLGDGLTLEAIKTITFTPKLAAEFYCEHLNASFFQELLDEMTSERCVAMILGGEDAVQKVRQINGATNPAEALPGTLRHEYGIKKKGPRNAVHGSDSPENAARRMLIQRPLFITKSGFGLFCHCERPRLGGGAKQSPVKIHACAT